MPAVRGAGVVARLNYTKRGSLAYEGSSAGSPIKRVDTEQRHDPQEVLIHDVRPHVSALDLDRNGLCLAELHTRLDETLDVLFEPDEREIQRTYWPECEAAVRAAVRSRGRPPVHVFAFGTQKFTEQKSRGFYGSYSRQVHCDFSDVVFDNHAPKLLQGLSALAELRVRHPEVRMGVPEGWLGSLPRVTVDGPERAREAAEADIRRVATGAAPAGIPEAEARRLDTVLLNAWRPYGGAVHDNALALLDWESLHPEHDIMQTGRGSAVRKGNFITPHHSNVWSCVAAHDPRHRWLYLSNQQPHELWIFKQGDSRSVPGLAKQVFHSSFRDAAAAPGAPPRRAIVVRVVCTFEPLLEGRL